MRSGDKWDPPPEAMERINRERVRMWRARQRLVGSYAVGIIAMWKIVTFPGEGEPYFWMGVGLIAFGLASLDQILKALGKK